MKGYHQDYREYPRANNALQNYYTNCSTDSLKNAQIKKVKSSELLPPMDKVSKPVPPKKPFIEPGVSCQPFEEILSTTCVTDNNINTYFIAKALKGPLLRLASQQCSQKQPAKKPSKKIPEVTGVISGSLGPHLQGYSTVTHQGVYRQCNEDKITIYLQEDAKWFSIYDGHGGSKCSQFLKDKLHEYFFASQWRKDIPSMLRKAFISAQAEWKRKGDNSGSCALVIFVHDNVCYAANLGDSRAILVSENATKFYQITKDHKPSNPEQQKRVIEAGGKIYQTTAVTETPQGIYDRITGPLRVLPGRLSTTRAFGDNEAKDTKDGNSKVVICEPEITSFEIDDHDLIVIGSDGLWDRLENKEVVEMLKAIQPQGVSGEEWYSKGAEQLLHEAMNRGSTDNISLIVVGLNDPNVVREPKKGNEHIKILSSIGGANKKKPVHNKENSLSYPDKMKEIDSKISQINRNASRILQQTRRS